MCATLIFINGNLTHIPNLKNLPDVELVICADGAVRHAISSGITPHIIIGDLDSIERDIKKQMEQTQVKWIVYPKEKDYTDSELAVRYALDHCDGYMYVCGVWGDRIDHVIANLHYISQLDRKEKIILLEGLSEIRFVSKDITLEGEAGDELSLIPFKGDCNGIISTGLYYPLKNESLQYASTRGVSNVFSEKRVKITIRNGTLMVIHTKKNRGSYV